jgi:hypothetical protein
VVVNSKPANNFCRATRRKVWCCSDLCAYQSLAIAQYGPASHRWPITLSQFIALKPLLAKEQAARREIVVYPDVRIAHLPEV